jgi:hypothetical protein
MAEGETRAALQLIQKDLDLPKTEINQLQSPQMEELHQYLTLAIRELLDTGFNKLLNALYRIDVSEKKVSEVIHLEAPDEIAPKLATLVIERELQKVYTRQKYSKPDK